MQKLIAVVLFIFICCSSYGINHANALSLKNDTDSAKKLAKIFLRVASNESTLKTAEHNPNVKQGLFYQSYPGRGKDDCITVVKYDDTTIFTGLWNCANNDLTMQTTVEEGYSSAGVYILYICNVSDKPNRPQFDSRLYVKSGESLVEISGMFRKLIYGVQEYKGLLIIPSTNAQPYSNDYSIALYDLSRLKVVKEYILTHEEWEESWKEK